MSAGSGAFDLDWLALREPADHAARSTALVESLAGHLAGRSELSVVDLGAGSGSNLRWLAPRLPLAQRWQLLDRDAALLERVRGPDPDETAQRPAIEFETRCLDLADLPQGVFDGADLVTASALFDLASRAWIGRVAEALGRSAAAALFALTVDGRRGFLDASGREIDDEEDRWMAAIFNRHQQRAKGLGDALGPEAARVLPAALERAGLTVLVEAADWRLACGHTRSVELGVALLEDWARAGIEQAPDSAGRIRAWRERRRLGLEDGRIGVCVGHVDVLALPSLS